MRTRQKLLLTHADRYWRDKAVGRGPSAMDAALVSILLMTLFLT